MTQETPSPRQHSNAYNIFILVLTIISLVILVVVFLRLADMKFTAPLGSNRKYPTLLI